MKIITIVFIIIVILLFLKLFLDSYEAFSSDYKSVPEYDIYFNHPIEDERRH